ncbi:MAG: permease-like cell division protein FtsX [Oscillospiraceae bacterium]|nr:permease-like cell division protein FtsX [Oscillospiraceae bacterium]
MRRNNFGYYIKEGVTSIFRHGFMSFASICIIVACLIIMGSFSLLALNVRSIISTLESENQILAYVDDAVSEADARALQPAIERLPNVQSAHFISKDTAFESFKNQYEDKDFLEDMESSVLRHRFIVYVDDIALMQETQDALLGIQGIAKVTAHLKIAQGFITVRNVVSAVSLVLVVVLLIISLFIMSNTIKLTTFERREEIAIMKMVGATSAFIRWPFVVEGMILGFVGAAVAYLIQWGLYQLVADRLVGNTGLNFLRVLPFSYAAVPMCVVFLVIGLGVGIIGSSTAIRNYLKV